MGAVSRYSKWVSLLAALVLIISCLVPWAFYPDLGKSFTGFFSQNNVYGKPGKLLVVMAGFSILAQFLPYISLKRVNMLLMALNFAYAIKSFIIYASCYQGYCPQKQAGIFMMLLSSALLLVCAVLPSSKQLASRN